MKKVVSQWSPEIVVGIITFLLSISHIANYTKFSPLDELRHLDYALEISSGSLPKLGDKLNESSMREEACRGIDLVGWTDPPCYRKVLLPEKFRDDGWQTASQHPPTYYATAGVFARILKSVGVTHTFVDGARLFSAFIAAIGMSLTCRLSRRLGNRASVSVALSLAFAATGVYLHQSSIVTPDSMALMVGALTGLVAIRYASNNLHAKWLYAVFIFAGLTKITNLLIVVVIATALIGYFFGERAQNSRPRRQYLHVIWAATSAFFLGISWIVFQSARATIEPSIVPQNQMLAFDRIPELTHLLNSENLFRWFPPINSYISGEFTSVYTMTLLLVSTWILIGGVLFVTLNYEKDSLISNLALSTMVVAIVGAPTFIVFSVVVNEVLINAEARYGLVLVPMFIACAASMIRKRTGIVFVWVLCTPLLMMTITQLWRGSVHI
jgi:4-amino-4-deoxy-L-arabinose transferase-like glycosyltransferase